jgi:hypothetical protein
VSEQGAMPTTGRWGWYRDHEGVDRRRVSTLVKEVETDSHNLDKWKQRQVLIGAARRGDLITAVKAMGAPDPMTGWTREQKKLQDELVDKATEAAKDTDGAITGTAMHTLTERVDRGEPLDVVAAGLPAVVGQGLRSYAALRELNGWRNIEIERTVECEELEVRGTFDRVDYLPELTAMLGQGTCQHECVEAGRIHHMGPDTPPLDDLPVIVDVKTEKDPTLNGLHIGPQLAIYSRARKMWRRLPGEHALVRGDEVVRYPSGDVVMVPNGEYVPAPCVRQDVAVVVHIADGDANPLLVNLAEGWAAAVAAYEQLQRKNRAKRKVGAAGAWFVPLPTKRPSTLTSFVEHAAASGYADPNRPALAAAAEHMAAGGSTTEGVGAVLVGAMDAEGRGQVGSVITPAPAVREEVAVRDAGSGLVSWQPAPAATTGDVRAETVAAADRLFDEHDETRRQLIAAIWQARTVDALAILWKMAQDRGVKWGGPVAMAGDARRRQIECAQRALHVGSGKCACGWMAGQIA